MFLLRGPKVRLGFVSAAVLIGGVGLVPGQGSAAPGGYVIRDLGTLPGGGQGSSFPNAINARGQIAGTSGTASDTAHSFLWDPATGVMTDLGTLGGEFSSTGDMNDAGTIVGTSENASGEFHAYLWSPATRAMIDLGTLGGNSSSAGAINNAGQVAGGSNGPFDGLHGFFWDPKTHLMRDIGTLPNGRFSFVTTMNNQGQV